MMGKFAMDWGEIIGKGLGTFVFVLVLFGVMYVIAKVREWFK